MSKTVITSILLLILALALVWLASAIKTDRSGYNRHFALKRPFWWQFNAKWRTAIKRFWPRTSHYDPQEEKLIRLLHGDRAAARRLIKGAGSVELAITQLLRDRGGRG